jgi:hypothetical protein
VGLKKLADADIESFIPLSRDATRGGKAVPIPELRRQATRKTDFDWKILCWRSSFDD